MNTYANILITSTARPVTKYSFANRWRKDTSIQEMKGFLLILLHIGFIKKYDYCLTDALIATPFAGGILCKKKGSFFCSELSIYVTMNSTYPQKIQTMIPC